MNGVVPTGRWWRIRSRGAAGDGENNRAKTPQLEEKERKVGEGGGGGGGGWPGGLASAVNAFHQARPVLVVATEGIERLILWPLGVRREDRRCRVRVRVRIVLH